MKEEDLKKILEKELSNKEQVDTIIKGLSPLAQDTIETILKIFDSSKKELPKDVIKIIGNLVGLKDDNVINNKNINDKNSENIFNLSKEMKNILEELKKVTNITPKVDDKNSDNQEKDSSIENALYLAELDDLEREISGL